MAKYKATVKMREAWSDYWMKKPSKNNVLESFADTILRGNIEKIFEITIEKVEDNEEESQNFHGKASKSSGEGGLH